MENEKEEVYGWTGRERERKRRGKGAERKIDRFPREEGRREEYVK